ncbi:Berberine bridge enzyme-like 26 [Bienertia sinuspersici]
MKIRSGGNDYEGLSYVSMVPYIVVDMFDFRLVDVNIEEETTWVGAGATLGKVYYAIANKSGIHAYPAGVCPTVGAGGYITGGGYGNLIRKYGLTMDNLVDATIVDVNGMVPDRATMGEELFWALRGGGEEGLYKMMVEFQTPQLTFDPYGGLMDKINSNGTPIPNREGNLFKLQYVTNWDESENQRSKYYIDLTRKLHAYMTPFVSNNPREAFLNYRDID